MIAAVAEAQLRKRLLNDAIRDLEQVDAARPLPFACECEENGCFGAVWLSRREYDESRADETWQVLAAGHGLRHIEMEEAA
jgi:hypothetical protein